MEKQRYLLKFSNEFAISVSSCKCPTHEYSVNKSVPGKGHDKKLASGQKPGKSGKPKSKVGEAGSLPPSPQDGAPSEQKEKKHGGNAVKSATDKQTPEQNKASASPSRHSPKKNASAGKSQTSVIPKKQEAPAPSGPQQAPPSQQEQVAEPVKKEPAKPSLPKEANKMQHCDGAPYPSVRERILKMYQSKIPGDCTKDDLSGDLKNEGLLRVLTRMRFSLSKRNAFVLFFEYLMYLEMEYYDMMDYLKKWFYGIAKDNILPDEYKLQWWEECKAELLRDLQCIHEECENSFSNFLDKRKGKNVWVSSFRNLLIRLNKEAHDSISQKRNKGVSILTERMDRYNGGATGKPSTQGKEKADVGKNKGTKEQKKEKEKKEKQKKESPIRTSEPNNKLPIT
ncbi:hypothetical protein AK88_01860 [Plasmodium fragile]|uniref:Plasmodium RESA N-terminal domain-containing protein n=1 Tax=Plasmodium fragile TaxID=5857 RepID=A0A0D9QNA3_PLAFR|nr:uncharacterized protein AK88_01860 [Plasmodium fragile]KJP88408.1 hypothetical protein AK88_01860 [Plasmodium fragile]